MAERHRMHELKNREGREGILSHMLNAHQIRNNIYICLLKAVGPGNILLLVSCFTISAHTVLSVWLDSVLCGHAGVLCDNGFLPSYVSFQPTLGGHRDDPESPKEAQQPGRAGALSKGNSLQLASEGMKDHVPHRGTWGTVAGARGKRQT